MNSRLAPLIGRKTLRARDHSRIFPLEFAPGKILSEEMDVPGEVGSQAGAEERSPAPVGANEIEESFSEIETYLNDLLVKAAPAWESIPDADVWLAEIRGVSDAGDA